MKETDDDIFAQVGLGAMVLFIGALIAITTSMYVMIHQLEVVTQSTQKVISTTSKEAHTQIIFVGAWIDDSLDDYLFMIEYQSLGKEVNIDEVGWVLWCVDDADNHHRRMGYLGDPQASAQGAVIWEVGDTWDNEPETLESGKRYFVVTDGGTGTAVTCPGPDGQSVRPADRRRLRGDLSALSGHHGGVPAPRHEGDKGGTGEIPRAELRRSLPDALW